MPPPPQRARKICKGGREREWVGFPGELNNMANDVSFFLFFFLPPIHISHSFQLSPSSKVFSYSSQILFHEQYESKDWKELYKSPSPTLYSRWYPLQLWFSEVMRKLFTMQVPEPCLQIFWFKRSKDRSQESLLSTSFPDGSNASVLLNALWERLTKAPTPHPCFQTSRDVVFTSKQAANPWTGLIIKRSCLFFSPLVPALQFGQDTASPFLQRCSGDQKTVHWLLILRFPSSFHSFVQWLPTSIRIKFKLLSV